MRAIQKTWAERMQEQYQEEGREQAARQILLRLLKLRFGPLPADVAARIETIQSVERLTRLAEQVVTAGSLAELGFD